MSSDDPTHDRAPQNGSNPDRQPGPNNCIDSLPIITQYVIILMRFNRLSLIELKKFGGVSMSQSLTRNYSVKHTASC